MPFLRTLPKIYQDLEWLCKDPEISADETALVLHCFDRWIVMIGLLSCPSYWMLRYSGIHLKTLCPGLPRKGERLRLPPKGGQTHSKCCLEDLKDPASASCITIEKAGLMSWAHILKGCAFWPHAFFGSYTHVSPSLSREREAKQKDQQRKKKKLNTKLLSFGEDGESDVKENGDVHAARITSVFEADVDDPRSISDSLTEGSWLLSSKASTDRNPNFCIHVCCEQIL